MNGSDSGEPLVTGSCCLNFHSAMAFILYGTTISSPPSAVATEAIVPSNRLSVAERSLKTSLLTAMMSYSAFRSSMFAAADCKLRLRAVLFGLQCNVCQWAAGPQIGGRMSRFGPEHLVMRCSRKYRGSDPAVRLCRAPVSRSLRRRSPHTLKDMEGLQIREANETP